MKLHPPTPIYRLAVGAPFVLDGRTYYRSFSTPYNGVEVFEVVGKILQLKHPKSFDKNTLVQPLVI